MKIQFYPDLFDFKGVSGPAGKPGIQGEQGLRVSVRYYVLIDLFLTSCPRRMREIPFTIFRCPP